MNYIDRHYQNIQILHTLGSYYNIIIMSIHNNDDKFSE